MVNNSTFKNENVRLDAAGYRLIEEPVKQGYSNFRKPENPVQERVLHTTALWILSLPAEARPLSLAKKYPRIVNILAKDWGYPPAFEKRMAEYMVNDRATRQGFPLDVVMDLANLKTHFMLVDPRVKQCAWDGIFITQK